jgi:hypothetical protein
MQTKAKVGKSADGFFKEAAAKDPLSDKRKADQKAVDTAVSSPFPPCSEYSHAYLPSLSEEKFTEARSSVFSRIRF